MHQKHCITSRLSVFPRAPILSFCFGTCRMPSPPMLSFLARRSPARSIWRRMMPVQSMAWCSLLMMHLMMRLWSLSRRYSIALRIQTRASMSSFRPCPTTPSRRTKSSTACTGHVFYVTCHGATALSSVPAAALRRFVIPHAWASCADHFRKRWISLWAPCAWAAPLSMRSCLAVAMPVASMPTAWCASSPRCPHRSGMPSWNASAPMLNQVS
jgi:hypothetical protein